MRPDSHRRRRAFRLALVLLLFGGTFGLLLRPTEPIGHARAGRERPGESDAMRSFAWWYSQRALPAEQIPVGAYEKAARYVRTKMRKEHPRAVSGMPPSQWNSLGPTNIGGRTLAIAVNPSTPNVVWAGAASGGLWKSTTGGVGLNAWTLVNTGFNTLSVSAIAIDPSNPNRMYIGTGEISLYHRPLNGVVGARASYGMGVLVSTNGGATWTQTGLTFTFPQITAVERLVINPMNTNTLYAATSEGVYKSTDAGTSWSLSHPVLMAMDLVINPADTTVLYASHGSANSSPSPGLYKTTDAGGSWTQLTNGLPASEFGRTALAISPSSPATVYAGITNSVSFQVTGLYKTTDGGDTWALVSSQPYVGTQGWYNNVVAVHPLSADTVFCSGLDIYKSTDGGPNLSPAPSFTVHVDHHAIAFDPTNPSVIYFGCDGGIWKTTDGGSTYTNLNNSYVTTQFYPGLALFPSDSNVALGGLQDNGTLRYFGAPEWSPVIGADGGWCAIDPTNSLIMYGETQWGGIEKSTNGGGNFFQSSAGLPQTTDDWNFIPPFILSPSSPNILYAGSRNVFKSTDGGGFWFSANGAPYLNGTNISCLGVSWSDANLVIAGTGDGKIGATPLFEIFRSTNGGFAWTKVSAGLPNRYPTDIEFDPTSTSIVYLTYSGYGTSHLFKSTNAGAAWTDISAGLPDIPHQAVTVDPENPQHVYVGTDLGVYHSPDRGTTWEEWNAGLPPAMVLDLAVSRANGKLRAATFGNGVLERALVRIPTLALVSPVGGEILAGGTSAFLRWSSTFLGAVKLEFSADDGASWSLIADNVPAGPGVYTWTVPQVATTQGRIRVSNPGDTTPVDSSPAPFTILVNPDLQSGWNLLSLELRPPDPRPSVLFPTAQSSAFEYASRYVAAESLRNGVGFWLKFANPQYHSLAGDTVAAETVDVRSGWNIIGSLTTPLLRTLISSDPPNIVRSNYFDYSFGYRIADTLQPRRGYWVRVNANGRLFLNSPALLERAVADRSPIPAEPSCTLTLSDCAGNRQTLTLLQNASTAAASDLPPLPPEGTFDIRFASGRMMEVVSADAVLAIAMQGEQYPLTIRWERDADAPMAELFTGEGLTHTLSGHGEMRLDRRPERLLVRGVASSGAQMPGGFTLFQNYPNPFNPETEFRFRTTLPGRVTLRVYDALGSEVATVLNEWLPAGEHTRRWTAAGLASGVYYSRITSGSEELTRKLLLLR